MRGVSKICLHIFCASCERIPTGGARTDIKGDFLGGHQFAFTGERVVALVAPIQGDQIFREFFEALGFFQDDVAPKHHLMITFVDLLLDLGEEIYVDIGGALLFAFGFAPPFT